MASIRIGPEFFANAKRDYSDWHWAWVRELAQNSVDAPGTRNIDVRIVENGNDTVATWENDGDPMDENVLVNKFLSLGASGKRCIGGTVGGFGKAKEVIAFAHKRWSIETGSLTATGCGGEYDLTTHPNDVLHGTRTTITMEGNIQDLLVLAVRKYAECCKWSGNLILNGQRLRTNNPNGTRRADFDWATVWTNNNFANRVVVRVDGVPMFTRYADFQKTVVVELKGSSLQALAANRDSLSFLYQSKLDSFLSKLIVDKRSAFKSANDQPIYTHFHGDLIRSETKVVMEDLIAETYATIPTALSENDGTAVIGVDRPAPFAGNEIVAQHTVSKVRCSYNFLIRNTTGLKVPDYLKPGRFSSYTKKLLKLWISCMTALHHVLGRSDEFSVGFIIDEDSEAMRENSGQYGQVYYINPVTLVKQKLSSSRSMKKRWKLTSSGKYAILACALHEFVHKEVGPHNEDYANNLTTLCGIAFAKMGTLRKALNAGK